MHYLKITFSSFFLPLDFGSMTFSLPDCLLYMHRKKVKVYFNAFSSNNFKCSVCGTLLASVDTVKSLSRLMWASVHWIHILVYHTNKIVKMSKVALILIVRWYKIKQQKWISFWLSILTSPTETIILQFSTIRANVIIMVIFITIIIILDVTRS